MNGQTAMETINNLLFGLGEDARVKQIEPYRAFVINVDKATGRKTVVSTPDYYGLSVDLSSGLRDPGRFRKIAGQYVNADIRIIGSTVYLGRRVHRMPFTAPMPR